MDRNDREAIEALFDKIAEVERNSPPRDGQSEALIRDKIGSHPAAPYYMAQTIVMQEQALEAAERRIAELEAGSGAGGGLFGSLFGGNRAAPQSRTSVPRAGRQAPAEPQGGQGFLAGAAQTALGVTGGVLLGNAITGMLGSGKAEAAETSNAKDETRDDQAAREEEDASHQDNDDGGAFEEASFDGGGDFGDF